MDYPIRLANQLRAHLRSLRKQHGLTQAQLGQRLGIGQVRVAEIEAKPGLVSVDQLIKLLSALGTSLVLRHLEGSPVSPAVLAAPEQTSTAAAPPSARKKSTLVAGKVRNTSSGLRIPPNKGSW
jgi:HTH-type transcriptional regulator/antitoxin HipB